MTTKNSDLVTNFKATPPVQNEAHQLHGRIRVAQGTLEMATGDLDAADIVLLAPIQSNASILSIQIASDDLDVNATETLAFNIGIHRVSDDSVVDADAYASAVLIGQDAATFAEFAFEARNIAATGQQMWEDGGEALDPQEQYYLSMTVSTVAATAQAGTLSYIIQYVVD